MITTEQTNPLENKAWFRLLLPVAIVLGCLILGGFLYAIQINKQNSIEKQQQMDLEAKAEIAQTKAEINQTKSIPINTDLKIELCKTEAKDYADEMARAGYMQASRKASAMGDTETASFYLTATFKPEHPIDYDSNYNAKYIECLKG